MAYSVRRLCQCLNVDFTISSIHRVTAYFEKSDVGQHLKPKDELLENRSLSFEVEHSRVFEAEPNPNVAHVEQCSEGLSIKK
jgi:hypothetical protein